MLKSKADTTTQTAYPESVPPTVDSITVSDSSQGPIIGPADGGSGFTPNEGTTKKIYIYGSLNDQNGCNNFYDVPVVIYRAGVDGGADCTPDTNNCYKVTLQPTDLTNCESVNDTQVAFETSFDLENYTDPTDAGSPLYSDDYWIAKVTAVDNQENSNYDTVDFDVNSLAAINIPSPTIAYGEVPLGDESSQVTLAIENDGNVPDDAEVVASKQNPLVGDMTSNLTGFNVIPASAVHYSLEDGFDYTDGVAISKDNSSTMGLDLPQQTEDGAINIPSVDTFWMLSLAGLTGIQGTYTNTLVFTAKTAAVQIGQASYDWVETNPVIIYDQSWYSLAASGDGSQLITGVFDGRLFTSADRGSHWTENRPDNFDSNGAWSAVGSNSTGQYLAASNNGYLYISADYGQTWVERMPKGYEDGSGMVWRLDISSDGSRILAADLSGRVYLSTDFGVNWSEKQPAGNVDQIWTAVAMDDSGRYLAAASRGLPSIQTGGRIYYSNDYGSTWSDKNPVVGVDKNWSALAMDSSGQHLIAGVVGGRVYVSDDGADSWTERNPIAATDKNWSAVGIDSTGQYLAAAVDNGRLYTSSNGGVAWTERQPNGDVNQGWIAVNIDSTGQDMIAVAYGSRIYSSIDHGSSWDDVTPAYGTTAYWQLVSSDPSGQNLLVGVSGGGLYHSTNAGTSWTDSGSSIGSGLNWFAADSDSTGQRLVLAVQNGRLYTSINSGSDWTERQPGGDADLGWSAVASDSSGSKLVAAVKYGRLYTSSDSGANWTERQPGGDADLGWSAVASDSSGSKLVAAVKYGRLYTSSDSGANWTERQPGGDVSLGWSAVASDSSGSKLVAVVQGGRVYTSSDSGISWIERQPAGDSNQQWVSIASDSSGTNLIIAGMSGFGGKSYVSPDSGVSWTQAPYNFDVVASDSTGLKMIGAKYNGRIYIGTGH